MNSVQLVGRFTRDPEVRMSNGGISITNFILAVDRKYKSEGQPTADFIPCTAFKKTAEFIEKYFKKGDRIGLNGRIQTGSYKKEDGTTVYTTDVIVEGVEFVESKGTGAPPQADSKPSADGFVNIPDGIEDDELPFN